jgi:hypothetical protein
MDAKSRIQQIDGEVRSGGRPNRPEALARSFEDTQITDLISRRAGGTFRGGTVWISLGEAASRLESILMATAKPAVPGLQTGGAIDGWDDAGFRPEFKDPHPSSNNQVGHFLTAVGLGYNPSSVRYSVGVSMSRGSGIVRGIGELLRRSSGLRDLSAKDALDPFGHYSDEEFAIRLMVGHEKYPDPIDDPSTFLQQFAKATSGDVAAFRSAEQNLGNRLPLDLKSALATLRGIAVDNRQRGNSYEDLLLSLAGWRLGRSIQYGTLSTRASVASWSRQTLM